jgi:predicted CXXCH cytochrome family protein
MVQQIKRAALAMTVVLAAVGVAWGSGGIFPIQIEGISPHEIEEENLHAVWADIAPTSGLPTVEAGTRVVMEAHHDSIVTMAWEITAAPDGDVVNLGLTGTDTLFTFVADSIGQYEVSLTVNDEVDASTLWITAAEYVGVGTIGGATPSSPQCGTCHSSKVDGWELTSHATATQRNLTVGFMSQSCMECHATGFDSTAWSDDFGFLFPAPGAGVYDSVLAIEPSQSVQFNVQCESCHGPGSEHAGYTAENQISDSYNAAVCAQCHDEPSHHPQPIAWASSAHGTYADITGSGHASSASCTRCHTAQGFVEETINGGAAAAYDYPEPITCAACHDPHDKPGEHNLRRGSVAEACTGCHTLRLSGYSGIHHSHQGSMLAGIDGIELPGYDYPVSAHSQVSEACATCHMAGLPGFITDAVTAEQISIGEASRIVGGHTFNVTGMWQFAGDTVETHFVNSTGCIECHGEVSIEFVELSQQSIMDLLDELKSILPVLEADSRGFKAGNPVFTGAELTAAEEAGAFNWYFVNNDNSYGVHNHDYAAALLRASIAEVQKTSTPGEIVSITDAPNDQGKAVRVMWNAFPAEESGTDAITAYQVMRWDDEIGVEGEWVIAGEVMANGGSRYALDVATDYDTPVGGETEYSFFQIAGIAGDMTHVSAVDSGASVDNLEPMAPAQAKFAPDTDVLSWAPSHSMDVQYYAIYKNRMNTGINLGNAPYLVVADTMAVVEGNFRYGIVAVDFSGNVSVLNPSAVINAYDVSVNPAPATTALLGNAPNPFNPSTEVSYQLHEAAKVQMTVYNILGQPVRTLVSGTQAAGNHSVNWDGRDSNGLHVASGAYLYVMTTENGFRSTGRMLLLR